MFRHREYRRINYRMLLYVVGILLMMESAFMLPPCLVSAYCGEGDGITFFSTFVMTLSAGGLMTRLSRPTHRMMGKREGFLLTASVWVVFSLFGMMPFIISPAPYTYVEAFTEAMSCFTTTGAAVVPPNEQLSHGINLWRAMMQWIGGMGIILFTLAVLPMLNYSGGMQMFNAEVTGITHDKIKPRISATAKGLWGTYTAFTIVLVLLLWAGPLTLFDSVTHGLVTMATGGISYYADGVEHFNSYYVKVVITVFMFIGSVNFGLIFTAATGRVRPLVTNGALRFMLWIIGVSVAAIMLSEYFHGAIESWARSLVDSCFMVVSAVSTTCFSLNGFDRWGNVTILLLVCLMFFGGCAGSTSGGAKIDRLIVLLKNSRNEIWRALQSNSVASVKIGSNTLSYSLVQKSIAFLCIDVMVVVAVTIVLAAMQVPVSDSAYITISCISNSGLLADVGSLGGSLECVPPLGKLLLSGVMLIGRLEFYTILVLFTGNFWHK